MLSAGASREVINSVPTPKPSIGVPERDELLDAVFVEIAGDDDLHIRSAVLVEDRASLSGQCAQIAAVDSNGLNRRLDRGSQSNALERVVGVDQQRGVSGKNSGERCECFGLGRKRLDPRMSHGAHRRHAQAQGGLDVTGALRNRRSWPNALPSSRRVVRVRGGHRIRRAVFRLRR